MNDHVCDPSDPDCAAHLHYLDPANQQPAGLGRHRRSRRGTWGTWNWSVLPDLIPQFRCEHMSASGLRLRSVACGVCGPLWRAPA